MATSQKKPVACTLTGGDFRHRIAWIADLARESLQNYGQRDLVLELQYGLEAAERVREMVRKETECCPFLTFDVHLGLHTVVLTITAPEEARGAAEFLFEQFIGAGAPCSGTNCCNRTLVCSLNDEIDGAKQTG